ncbi:MAG: RNA pseudouridine synthase [Alistipes sp.]|nr:RNA pseudouridine synthase [Alistipes sp.]
MLHRFATDISHIERPKLFTWPFHYVPHELSTLAAGEVQQYLKSRPEWHEEIARGKMFGVLVVEDERGELGFLAAFSGNLMGRNYHDYFVPPIYDMLQPGDFFRRGEAEISAINRTIAQREASDDYRSAYEALQGAKQSADEQLSALKAQLKERKAERDRRRKEGENAESLILESQRDNAELQRLKRAVRDMVAEAQHRYDELHVEVEALKQERQQRSSALQMQLFAEFRILNARGEVRNLCELFAPTPQLVPPAGAGECAAPKLLQYAYLNRLRPVTMAEFWQGASPRGEVRHDGAFYPACNGKCKPILTHMLEGLAVEPNPLTQIAPPEPRILWEDSHIVVIDKPCGMLSVDGKSGVRSVEQWAHEHYPEASGPMIVHRLDQSTSGILLLAKDKDTHKAMQQQFVTRSVSKQYTALLDGVVEYESGIIDLSMKLDYDNRPRQMVAPDGKRAITEYRVVAVEEGRTRIHFYPLTGRTHQLRLHSAHPEGLNTPIVGDDIYGHEQHADLSDGHRLCLHASRLEFMHPHTKERIVVESEAEF